MARIVSKSSYVLLFAAVATVAAWIVREGVPSWLPVFAGALWSCIALLQVRQALLAARGRRGVGVLIAHGLLGASAVCMATFYFVAPRGDGTAVLLATAAALLVVGTGMIAMQLRQHRGRP
jgi:hypothetical protein